MYQALVVVDILMMPQSIIRFPLLLCSARPGPHNPQL